MAKFTSTVELDLVNDSSFLLVSDFADEQILRQTENIIEVRIGDIVTLMQGDFSRGINSTASYFRVYRNEFQYIELDDININLIDLLQSVEEFGEDEALNDFFASADQFFGSRFSDKMNGFGGADVIYGGGGDDSLSGGVGDDTVLGQSGGDALTGNEGDDLLNGGEGFDQARFSGAQTSYTLTLSPTSTTITDRRVGGNGTDELIDIEFLDFDAWAFPYKFDLTKVGGTTGINPEGFESFIELYIAYFNRAPDAVGLNFWGTAFANGFTLEQIAAGFIDQDETRAAYPESLSNEDFATVVYGNVLGRIPDQTGFDFWVGALDSGGVSRDQFILSVLGGAKVDPPANATQEFIDQQILDRAYLETKTDIGAYFAVHKGMSDVDNAMAAMGFFNGTAPSVISVIDAIDGFYADALDPENGEFLMQLVGVLDDPFSIA